MNSGVVSGGTPRQTGVWDRSQPGLPSKTLSQNEIRKEGTKLKVGWVISLLEVSQLLDGNAQQNAKKDLERFWKKTDFCPAAPKVLAPQEPGDPWALLWGCSRRLRGPRLIGGNFCDGLNWQLWERDASGSTPSLLLSCVTFPCGPVPLPLQNAGGEDDVVKFASRLIVGSEGSRIAYSEPKTIREFFPFRWRGTLSHLGVWELAVIEVGTGAGLLSLLTPPLLFQEAGMTSGDRLELLIKGFLQHLGSPEYFLFFF